MKAQRLTVQRKLVAGAATALLLMAVTGCTDSARSAGTTPATAAATSTAAPDAGTDIATDTGSTGTDAAGTDPTETGGADPSPTVAPGSPDATAESTGKESPASTDGGTTAGASPTQDTAGTTGGAGSTDLAFPDQPAVVAAAKASMAQVVQLHALAVSAGQPDRIPGEVIPSSAAQIADTLDQQVTMLLAMAPAADSEQAALADTLTTYQDLAGQLEKWDPAAGTPMDKAFFAALAKNDKAWLAAMAALGKVTGENLTEGLPELLMPTG